MVEDVSNAADRELILAEALAAVPGYRRGAPATRMPGGSVNRSYRVDTAAGRFVMRLSLATDAWLTTDRSVERELQAVAAEAGLAPRLIRADSQDRWLISEYVDGRVWTDAAFADPRCLEHLGHTLRRLHVIEAPAAGRFDLLNALQGYARRIDKAGNPGSETITHYLEWVPEARQVSGAAERPLSIVHHDVHASNIIETSRALLLIDWECAAVSDPLLDVACILSYYPATSPHSVSLLRHSGLENVTQRQLAAALWLFDFHTCLWYRERRLRLLPSDAELAAERRLSARLAAGLARWQSAPGAAPSGR